MGVIGLEDRPILMMDGFVGQQVVIDFNNNRIITAHSTDRHYDYYNLIYKVTSVGAKSKAYIITDTSLLQD